MITSENTNTCSHSMAKNCSQEQHAQAFIAAKLTVEVEFTKSKSFFLHRCFYDRIVAFLLQFFTIFKKGIISNYENSLKDIYKPGFTDSSTFFMSVKNIRITTVCHITTCHLSSSILPPFLHISSHTSVSFHTSSATSLSSTKFLLIAMKLRTRLIHLHLSSSLTDVTSNI